MMSEHLRDKAGDTAQAREPDGMAVDSHTPRNDPEVHLTEQSIEQGALASP